MRVLQLRRGHSLIEMAIAIALLTLVIVLVGVNGFAMLRREQINDDVGLFARTLRTTAEQAIFHNRSYDVVIEVTDGYYTVYETQSEEDDVDQEMLEPVIATRSLDVCYIDLIEYEDGTQQFSGEITLQATPQGWDKTVLFEFLDDRDEAMRFMRVDQLTPRVVVSVAPLDMLYAEKDVSMHSPL